MAWDSAYAFLMVVVMLLGPLVFVPWDRWDTVRKPLTSYLILFVYLTGRTMLILIAIGTYFFVAVEGYAFGQVFAAFFSDEYSAVVFLFAKGVAFFAFAGLLAHRLWRRTDGETP